MHPRASNRLNHPWPSRTFTLRSHLPRRPGFRLAPDHGSQMTSPPGQETSSVCVVLARPACRRRGARTARRGRRGRAREPGAVAGMELHAARSPRAAFDEEIARLGVGRRNVTHQRRNVTDQRCRDEGRAPARGRAGGRPCSGPADVGQAFAARHQAAEVRCASRARFIRADAEGARKDPRRARRRARGARELRRTGAVAELSPQLDVPPLSPLPPAPIQRAPTGR